jgi:hypothetical protein
MVDSILRALEQIKADVAEHLQPAAIEGICRDVNYHWRERVLGPVVTMHAFLLQVLHKNTACDHVPHLMGKQFTGEAYAQARGRLPLELFERLLWAVCRTLKTCGDESARWLGHRVWILDGSGCSMPDTPELQQAFGQPSQQAPGCGFPVAHLLTLFHAGTGLLQKVLVAPLRTHDLAGVEAMHAELAAGDVVVGDRGLCSYVHLALLVQAGLHGVFRLHQKMAVSFRIGRMHSPPRGPYKNLRGLPRSEWIKWLGRRDQCVRYFKPKQRPKWLSAERFAALPGSLVVRELRYRITRPGYRTREVTLVTTLLDAERYPAEELAQLYADRWQIETNLRHLKQTLQMDVLRCKTVAGVHKELRMIALVYNLVRLVMLKSSRLQDVPVDRISFIDALRWLTQAGTGPAVEHLILVPQRSGRVEPRVLKRRLKEYDLMKKPRAILQQALLSQRHAA